MGLLGFLGRLGCGVAGVVGSLGLWGRWECGLLTRYDLRAGVGCVSGCKVLGYNQSPIYHGDVPVDLT